MKRLLFRFPEDREFFAQLLALGKHRELEKQFGRLFDFTPLKSKRRKFHAAKSRAKLIQERGCRCQLRLPGCERYQNLVVDHYIPLASNELNKKLRGLAPERGKKVRSQSLGSNDTSNLLLACGSCNGLKKHRFCAFKEGRYKIVEPFRGPADEVGVRPIAGSRPIRILQAPARRCKRQRRSRGSRA